MTFYLKYKQTVYFSGRSPLLQLLGYRVSWQTDNGIELVSPSGHMPLLLPVLPFKNCKVFLKAKGFTTKQINWMMEVSGGVPRFFTIVMSILS